MLDNPKKCSVQSSSPLYTHHTFDLHFLISYIANYGLTTRQLRRNKNCVCFRSRDSCINPSCFAFTMITYCIQKFLRPSYNDKDLSNRRTLFHLLYVFCKHRSKLNSTSDPVRKNLVNSPISIFYHFYSI